jgi:hypothetical protein
MKQTLFVIENSQVIFLSALVVTFLTTETLRALRTTKFSIVLTLNTLIAQIHKLLHHGLISFLQHSFLLHSAR